jgi:hypothetical protein
MLQSLEKSITLKSFAKGSTEMQTLNGKHAQLANPRQRKFWTYQTLKVQAQQKREQHASLCTALTSAGWRIHNAQPTVLMLGQAGTLLRMFSEWPSVLKTLGVAAHRAESLMRSLHLHVLRYALSINTQRLKLERGPNRA